MNEKARHQDRDEIPAKLDDKTVNLATTVITLFYDFCKDNRTTEDKHLREYRRLYGSQSGKSPVGLKKVRYMSSILTEVKNFASWFQSQGYISPSVLSAQLVQQWGQNRSSTQKTYLLRLVINIFRTTKWYSYSLPGIRLSVTNPY